MVWFGALRSIICYMRTNLTGAYCLPLIPNSYKHSCLKWNSNLHTTVPNGSALPFDHQAVHLENEYTITENMWSYMLFIFLIEFKSNSTSISQDI